MRFAYYSKLSAVHQRVYRESDEIPTLELPPGAAVTEPVAEGKPKASDSRS